MVRMKPEYQLHCLRVLLYDSRTSLTRNCFFDWAEYLSTDVPNKCHFFFLWSSCYNPGKPPDSLHCLLVSVTMLFTLITTPRVIFIIVTISSLAQVTYLLSTLYVFTGSFTQPLRGRHCFMSETDPNGIKVWWHATVKVIELSSSRAWL